MKINDIKVKNKLVLLYILAVLIPVIITDFTFYNAIYNNVKDQRISDINQSIQRVELNLKNYIDTGIGISNIFYADEILNSILDKEYSNTLEYLNDYDTYIRPIITRYIPIYTLVDDITIYGNNNSLIDGGAYMNIQGMYGYEWFGKFAGNKDSLLIKPYLKSKEDPYLSNSKTNRKFSIIRKLNLSPYTQRSNVIRIDIRTQMIYDLLKNEKIPGTMMILDSDNRIIASNIDQYNRDSADFTTYIEQQQKDNIIVRNYIKDVAYLSGWSIISIVPEENIIKIRDTKYLLVLFVFVNLFIPSIIIFMISMSFTSRIKKVSAHLKKFREQDYSIIDCVEGKDEIGALITEFNKMSKKVKQLIQDVYEAQIQKQTIEIKKQQAELNALQSQINPHFLFNALETIRMRSLIKNETETSEIIKQLARMFRRVIRWSNDLITIEEELQFVKDYLNIQKYRYDEALSYEINLQQDLKEYKIPKMCIQTFVENASVHGIEKTEGIGFIRVTVKSEENSIYFIIEDNGKGMSKEKLEAVCRGMNDSEYQKDNIGIRNVHERLKMLYANGYDIGIKSQEGIGTRITVIIPYITS